MENDAVDILTALRESASEPNDHRLQGVSAKDGELKVFPIPISRTVAVWYAFAFNMMYPDSYFTAEKIEGR